MPITNSRLEQIASGDKGIREMFNLARQFQKKGKRPIDLSLGNPQIKPPEEYYVVKRKVVSEAKKSKENLHKYMPNPGYDSTRERVASDLKEKLSIPFKLENVFMTSGCTNALDTLLASLIDPDGRDGVIVIAPYFPEYDNYVRNNNGHLIKAFSDDNFELDLITIESCITTNTAAIILNSPNNPSGQMYSEGSLKNLAGFLNRLNSEFGTSIAVIEDSPYDLLTFGNNQHHSILKFYENSIYCNSFSKSLGIAGERIGYMAVHPKIGDNEEDKKNFLNGLTANLRSRIVNANATQQKIVDKIGINMTSDVKKYEDNVNLLARTLKELEFGMVMPKGAFYLFPEIPEKFKDEAEFRGKAHNGDNPLLYTPGIAFGGERYCRNIRLSVSIADTELERACDKFRVICKD